jgi:hypothetical protein
MLPRLSKAIKLRLQKSQHSLWPLRVDICPLNAMALNGNDSKSRAREGAE